MNIGNKIKAQIVLMVVTMGMVHSVSAICDINILKTTPLVRFTNNNDGSVTDNWTKLTWKQCIEGTLTDGANGCSSDKPLALNWQDSLKRAVAVNAGTAIMNLGYDTWRLPNIKELESIVERQCQQPAINLTLFPDTPSGSFWSSTVYAGLGSAWHVSFYSGSIVTNGITQTANVRLVRN